MPKIQSDKENKLTILFHATLSHKAVSSAFYEFLQKEKFTNNWDFIISAHLLKSYIDQKCYNQAVENMELIADVHFLKEEKTLFLNYSNTKEIHNKIIENLKTNNSVEASRLIDLLKEELLSEYERTYFQKFLLTPQSQKLIEKYKKDVKIIVPELTRIYDYTDEDFMDGKINQKDLDFFSAISNEKSFVQPNITVDSYGLLFSNYNYLPNLSFTDDTKIVKFDLVFDYPFEQTFCAILDGFFTNDPHIAHFEILEYVPKQHFIMQQYSYTWGVVPSTRRSVVTITYSKDRVDVYRKPVKIEGADFHKYQLLDFKKSDGTIEKKYGIQDLYFSHAEFIKLDEKRTLFKTNSFIGLGKKSLGVPKTLLKWKFNDFYTRLAKILKKTSRTETVSDYKKKFTKKKDGIPIDPVGCMLVDVYTEKEEKKMNEVDISQNILMNILRGNNVENKNEPSNGIEIGEELIQEAIFSKNTVDPHDSSNHSMGCVSEISEFDELLSFIGDDDE
eukprot:gene10233-2653_t